MAASIPMMAPISVNVPKMRCGASKSTKRRRSFRAAVNHPTRSFDLFGGNPRKVNSRASRPDAAMAAYHEILPSKCKQGTSDYAEVVRRIDRYLKAYPGKEAFEDLCDALRGVASYPHVNDDGTVHDEPIVVTRERFARVQYYAKRWRNPPQPKLDKQTEAIRRSIAFGESPEGKAFGSTGLFADG